MTNFSTAEIYPVEMSKGDDMPVAFDVITIKRNSRTGEITTRKPLPLTGSTVRMTIVVDGVEIYDKPGTLDAEISNRVIFTLIPSDTSGLSGNQTGTSEILITGPTGATRRRPGPQFRIFETIDLDD